MAQLGIDERILSVNHVVYLFNQAGCFSKRASLSSKYKTNHDLIPEAHLTCSSNSLCNSYLQCQRTTREYSFVNSGHTRTNCPLVMRFSL